MAGCSGRSAPDAIWFGGPIMHENHQSISAHSSHVETGNGRQPGRERQVVSVTAATVPCEVPLEAANSRSTSPLPSDRVGQRREHRHQRTCISQTRSTDGTQRYPSIATEASAYGTVCGAGECGVGGLGAGGVVLVYIFAVVFMGGGRQHDRSIRF